MSSSTYAAYVALVADLREALDLINKLRIDIARGYILPTEQLNTIAQGITVPFLSTSNNELFFEPTILPMHTNVACTIHVARGEGDVFINPVDANKVQVITEQSRTSFRGGAIGVVRLLDRQAQITVTFSNDTESIQRLFQLKSV